MSMDRSLLTAAVLLLLFSAPAIQAGRLLREEKVFSSEENPSVPEEKNRFLPNKNGDLMGAKRVPSLEGGLVLSALPKGYIPSSGPSKKGHSTIVDEKLFARYAPDQRMDRILKSVPSPGVGH